MITLLPEGSRSVKKWKHAPRKASAQMNLRLLRTEYRFWKYGRMTLCDIWRLDYSSRLRNYRFLIFAQRIGHWIWRLMTVGHICGNICQNNLHFEVRGPNYMLWQAICARQTKSVFRYIGIFRSLLPEVFKQKWQQTIWSIHTNLTELFCHLIF